MQTQNLKNHARFVPGFHFVILPLLLFAFIAALVYLIHFSQDHLLFAVVLVALSFATLLLSFFARGFSLKAQDRAIRAEENFRHYIATGKPLDKSLTMGQIIALRFAGDDEFIALAKKAAAEKMSSKDIKTAIQNWKGDYNRV